MLPRVARFAGRLAGWAGLMLLAYDIWQESQKSEGEWTHVFVGGKPGVYVWSLDPAYAVWAGGGRARIAGTPRTDGQRPGLGERGFHQPGLSWFPVHSSANQANWMPAGTKYFNATRTNVVSNGTTQLFKPGIVSNATIDVGQPDLIGALNAFTIVTLRIDPAQMGNNLEWMEPDYITPPRPGLFSFPQGVLGPAYNYNPIFTPIGAPAFAANPGPVAWAPPRLDPPTPEWPEVGPRPQPRPDPWPSRDAAQEGSFRPGAVEISPHAPPRPVSPLGPRPPGPRTKERKAGLPPWAAAVWHGLGPITETVDIIDAVYEALDKQTKRDAYKRLGRQPTPQERLEIIYRNIHKLNMGDVVKNIVENQAEDFVFGKFGKALGQASANSGRPIGYGAGPAL